MRKLLLFVAIVVVVLFYNVSGSEAQRGIAWKGGGGWGAGAKYNKMYNPATVETISGEVVTVSRMVPVKGMSYGIHMMVKTEKESISVHLGPGWFIENQVMKFAPGDRVEVKGSRIIFDGKPAVIAAEVKKGDDVLKLRDESGFPVWSPRRK